jgi:hypothetical protein
MARSHRNQKDAPSEAVPIAGMARSHRNQKGAPSGAVPMDAPGDVLVAGMARSCSARFIIRCHIWKDGQT